jgi:hypothetical protein
MKVVLFFLGFVLCAQAHMSIYVPSMWGSEPGNINSNWAVQPLENLNFVDWWWHGTKSINDPPVNNAVTELEAGGTYDFQITGNKAFTTMGRGLCCQQGHTPRNIPDPWSNGMNGLCSANIHAQTYADVAGCALGIAYKSEQNQVQPEDFVIFSVVHDCIARQLQTFDIPALPACPNGKCICSWFWIHNSTGGTDQMYMTAFQCNITNASKRQIGKPVAPVRCDGKPSCYLYPNWGNKTNECSKALNPMYWANNERNNMFNPTNAQCAPTYNTYYGFPDGAQHQIFTNNPAPPSGSHGDTLFSFFPQGPTSLTSGSSIVSPSLQSQLVMQGDGDLVFSYLGNGNKTIWTSNTGGKGNAPYTLTMQQDGNLVLTDSKSSALWTSGSAGLGYGPYRLKIRDTNQLLVVDRDSTPLWSYDKGLVPIVKCPQNS